MMSDTLSIDTAAGVLILRDERPDDAGFLFRLFADTNAVMQAELPPPVRDALLAMQHRSQTATYRAECPAARRSVVELAGAPVGRIVADHRPDVIHIVDVAVSPSHQARGIGTALVRAVMDEAAAHGHGVSALVAATNGRSLALFRKLGFAETSADEVHVELRWHPTRSD